MVEVPFSFSWNKYSDTRYSLKRENTNLFVYAMLQIFLIHEIKPSTTAHKIKRRTLNVKINDNHVLWVIREYEESKARKPAPEKREKKKKLLRKITSQCGWILMPNFRNRLLRFLSMWKATGRKHSHGWTK